MLKSQPKVFSKNDFSQLCVNVIIESKDKIEVLDLFPLFIQRQSLLKDVIYSISKIMSHLLLRRDYILVKHTNDVKYPCHKMINK